MVYKVLLRKEPEGGFTIFVPSLEGCITYGETLEEAQKNAKEAIELYLESLDKDNKPFPKEFEASKNFIGFDSQIFITLYHNIVEKSNFHYRCFRMW